MSTAVHAIERTDRDGRDVLVALRTASATEHARLETLTGLPDAVREPGRYATILRAFLDVVGPLEITLAAVAPGLGIASLVPEPRADLLRRDLRALRVAGLDPADAGRRPTPFEVRAAVPVPHDVPGALGCAYVLEGSRLGGRMIAPAVEAMLDRSPGAGTAFLRGGDVDAGRAWRRFRHEAALAADRRPDLVDAASEAAVATFRAFRLAVEARTGLRRPAQVRHTGAVASGRPR